MIGSSSIVSSAFRTSCCSSFESDRQSGSTDSAIRRRSFHKKFLRQDHRPAADLFVGGVEARAKNRISGDGDRLAKGHVFVVGSEDRDRTAVALEERSLTGQRALADDLAYGVA